MDTGEILAAYAWRKSVVKVSCSSSRTLDDGHHVSAWDLHWAEPRSTPDVPGRCVTRTRGAALTAASTVPPWMRDGRRPISWSGRRPGTSAEPDYDRARFRADTGGAHGRQHRAVLAHLSRSTP